MKARLLFLGTAFASGVIAFAVGYRNPGFLRITATKLEQPPDVAHVSTDHPSVASTSSALRRDNLQVEGFAKIGFAEMEELLTTSSPEQRERWAEEVGALADSTLKPIALVAFYTAWLDLKPDEALSSLRKFPALMYRPGVFNTIRTAVPTTLLPEMIDVIAELSEAERSAVLPQYLATLAQTDPAAAARFFDSHPKLVSGSDAEALIATWARDNIEAATRWLEASEFVIRPAVLRSLVEAWAAKDPAAAENYVVLRKDNDEFIEAANSLALLRFKTSPERARDFIMKFDDQHGSQLVMNLVFSMQEDQLANFVTWASSLPQSVAADGLGNALGRWSSVDPKQALDWISAKPQSERESLVIQIIRSELAPVSPEVVALAYNIRDPQKRDESLSILVRTLAAETDDPTNQIRALGLSAAQTKHLLELRPKPRE